jgi:hypothetical protein
VSSEWTPIGPSAPIGPADSPRRESRAARRRSASARGGILAVVLLVLAVVAFGGYLALDGSEHHSFNAGAAAPSTVHVTQGKQYEISTPGGLKGLADRGIDAAAVACTYRQGQGVASVLTTSTLAGSRTTHAVATFLAPVTGDVHVECTLLSGGTFVDDSDDGAADASGFFLLVSTVFAALAVPLGLAYLYRRSTARRAQEPAAVPDEAFRGDGRDELR